MNRGITLTSAGQVRLLKRVKQQMFFMNGTICGMKKLQVLG